MAYYFIRSKDLPWNMRRKRGENTIQYRSCLPSGIIDHPSASVLRFYRKIILKKYNNFTVSTTNQTKNKIQQLETNQQKEKNIQ